MLKALSLALLLIASPALAQAPAAPQDQVCVAPDDFVKGFEIGVVVADLKDAELKAFNDNFEKLTGKSAPSLATLDRLIVFSSKSNPDDPTYIMAGAKADCMIGVQSIAKETFESFRDGKPVGIGI